MKIIIQIPQLIYAGAEKVLVDFANFLYEQGNEVEILETYEKGFLKPQFNNGITFSAICSKEYTKKYYASAQQISEEKNIIKKMILCLKKMFSIVVGYEKFAEFLLSGKLKNIQYDVAVNYLEIQNPKFMLKNIKANKYIQWIHIDVSKASINKQFEKFYKKFDKIICVSQYAESRFAEKYAHLSDKTDYIYNFYNVNQIIEKSTEECVSLKGPMKILSVGRLTEQKAYLRALNVVKKLADEGYVFKWYIIGEGYDREKILDKIKKLNLENVVYLLGVKDNPYPYIKECDLFFLPSLYEGFPTVTIEAKILNKPVLATRVSGIEEQLIDKKTGLIVDNNETGIYEGLRYLLDNPKETAKLSDNSNIDEIVDSYIKYERFMNYAK